MECHFTLPAESYSLTNGNAPKSNQSARPLAGNNLWAVGHLADSTNHNLFYFDGIKGGKCVWHKFQTPVPVAEEIQLELTWEGDLGLRMDRMLFVGKVRSVSETRIDWTTVSRVCRDFQIGQDYVCHRKVGSEKFLISRCDTPEDCKELPSIPSAPSCYCLSSRDDVILLSGSDVMILKIPHGHWLRISTSVARSFPYFSAPKLPEFSQLLVTGGNLCGLPADSESLFVLPLAESPSWSSSKLSVQVRDLSAMSGPALSFLIIDNHFVLHTAVLDSALRLTDLSPSVLPDKEVLLTSVRSIRSLFNKTDDLSSICSSLLAAPPSDNFFTAEPPEDQAMEQEPTGPFIPRDFLSQPISFPSHSPPGDTFLSPTREPFDQSEVSILSSAPIEYSTQSPPFDWRTEDAEETSGHTIGTKRPPSPSEESPHKFSRPDVELPPYDFTDHTSERWLVANRTSEERRIHRRFLRETRTPCPLSECSFIPSWRDFSYFQGIAGTRPVSPVLLEETQTILAEHTFEFSEAHQEATHLSRIYPGVAEGPYSPPPPSAPATQDFSL